jgi:carbamoyl-phosphate synthase small subunit
MKNKLQSREISGNGITGWQPIKKTGVILFSDGSIKYGYGIGKIGVTSGEVCFNTSITGYQEIISDPSYSHQIVNFTFPHIGNVGANFEDLETANPDQKIHISGIITHAIINSPSNYRAKLSLNDWMKQVGIIGISGIDTRQLTKNIRDNGMMNCVIEHSKTGNFDIPKLQKILSNVKSMEGMDLATDASTKTIYKNYQKSWNWDSGYEENKDSKIKIALIDYGIKTNIIRMLNHFECEIKVFPPDVKINEIFDFNPDGVLLSNGPGDPHATINFSVPLIKNLIQKNIPIFGICLGHQILALALGAKTIKMSFGHHGANHPVQDMDTKKVLITSMNHGFAVDSQSLPNEVVETHRSLFDGSNCGIRVKEKPIFSVQFHPEASPGPQDCYYIFESFLDNIKSNARNQDAKKN